MRPRTGGAALIRLSDATLGPSRGQRKTQHVRIREYQSASQSARRVSQGACITRRSAVYPGIDGVIATSCRYRGIPARFASTYTPAKPATVTPKPPTTTAAVGTSSPPSKAPTIANLSHGLNDAIPAPLTSTSAHTDPADNDSSSIPEPTQSGAASIDWARSFQGLSTSPFSKEAADTLLAPIEPADVEVKPDGILYLPEIKYRRILNRAFGPGGWGLAPRSETLITGRLVTREFGLVVAGRLVSIARGEQSYFDPEGIPTATEGCKSNALMRCCKDIGVASELWDPAFIRRFKKENTRDVWVEHVVTKKKKRLTYRKDVPVAYPYKESSAA